MPTKAQPKRSREKARALKKKAAKKTRARVQNLLDDEPATMRRLPSVDLTVAGPGLQIEISASFEIACRLLAWLQGQVIPKLIDRTTELNPPRWLEWDEVDALVRLVFDAPGLSARVFAHEDIAQAFAECFQVFLKSHAATAPAPPPPPPPPDAPPRDTMSSEPVCPCPLCFRVTCLGDCHEQPPPQGVRYEDDAQGNPRIVKNEPTSG